jgi:DNA-binding MarR family transcriptional regulator
MIQEFQTNPLKQSLLLLAKQAKTDLERRVARSGAGITGLEFGVLFCLKAESGTINDLARRMHLRPPSLVPPVDALQRLGLLIRKRDTRDRRKIQLHLLKKGAELVAAIPWDDKNDTVNRAFRRLGPIKQKQLLNLLQELSKNL